MKFTEEQFVVLADGFGLVARGCKKIRKILLDKKSPDEESEVEDVTSEELPNEYDDILNEDFLETSKDYMYSSQMKWGVNEAQRFFVNMVNGRMRCNAMKFCWVWKGGSFSLRKNWRKISVTQAEDVYSRIRRAWSHVIAAIEDCSERPKKIRKSKWGRRKGVLDIRFPLTLFETKGFKRILIDRHSELPPLR